MKSKIYKVLTLINKNHKKCGEEINRDFSEEERWPIDT